MKNQILIFALIVLSFTTYSQDFSKLSKIDLEDKSDYAQVEDIVLKASNYILDNPINDNDKNRIYTLDFIMRWMSGTPDFTFVIGSELVDISKKNKDLLNVYLASMVKYALENRENAGNEQLVRKQAIIGLLNYIENPEYKIKQNKYIKKYIKARNEGKLDEFINNK